MHVIRGRNVNELFVRGLEHLSEEGVRQESRNGPVFVAPTPVVSVYEKPCERVLFDATRDANPFFHLFECLWMLSGQNNARMLDRYVADFSARYADNGMIHGAYGHRWRHALGFDQLDAVVDRLKNDHQDRQAVIQMWDATQTLEDYDQTYPGANDLLGSWKDRPCNTHVYLRVRQQSTDGVETRHGVVPRYDLLLDLTVLCRSNDVVWGAYGANAVHFSFLQEYLAGRIGVGVGRMYQMSNNFHGYVDTLDKLGNPAHLPGSDPYDAGAVHSVSIGNAWEHWDSDLMAFMGWHQGSMGFNGIEPDYKNDWFRDVAQPMCLANWHRRKGDIVTAIDFVSRVKAADWMMAGAEWLQRRVK